MLAAILALAIDAEAVCAKYGSNYAPPPVAVSALRECGGEGHCHRELAEAFANGDGVTRDFDIAEYFLCKAEDDMAPAEFEGMFAHLQAMRAGEETAALKFCDHVTSGYGMTYGSGIVHAEVMPQLEARVEKLRSGVEQTTAFDALRRRGEAWVSAESERIGELSRGGTGYPAFSLEAEMSTKQRFVENLERWSKERAPATSAAELASADADLNSAYRAGQNDVAETIDALGEGYADFKTLLRDAQRAWIAYRDAFAAYYAERWRGKASPEALKREIVTHLTRERAAELRNE
jgi:uncharacterized protein YecT (DUF1311 family)